jgi:membrane-bound lytic murein transglycosylase D
MIMDSASKLPTYTAAMLANRGQAVDSTGQLIATLGDLEDEVLNKKVKKTFYKVRRGETLSRIAQRFNVDVYDLKVWNRIRKNNALQAGQKLIVYREVRVSAQQQEQVAQSLKKFKPKYVTVQRGDTLWSISQRYGGVSVEKIKKLNGIRGNNLKAGQKIRLS